MTEIKFDKRNYRIHGARNQKIINKSLKEYGAARSIVVDNDNQIIGGNGVYREWQNLKGDNAPIKIVETTGDELVVVKRTDIAPDSKERQALAVMDNTSSDLAEFDYEMMQQDMDDATLEDFGIDLRPSVQKSDVKELPRGNLADDFLIMPASILNTRDAKWQARKRAWNDLIGDEGESRIGTLGFSELITSKLGKRGLSNVSILDATLAEIINKWFLPTEIPAGEKLKTCDPFAGDSVFGYVSGYLGAEFTGIELRQEQADLNNMRGEPVGAHYICDDGQNIAQHLPKESQDLVFSCPPYFDLEKYSDDPKDASNQKDYESFKQILANALIGACSCLKNNRFAAIVMSNVRNHTNGAYYDICGDICKIMESAGLILYNEFILVNSIGTGAMRTRGNMKTRKNVRCHQEVLIFYKGENPQCDIPKEFGKIALAEINESEGDADAGQDVE